MTVLRKSEARDDGEVLYKQRKNLNHLTKDVVLEK